MITLATATAYVGQMTAKQVATVVGKLAADRLWALKAAHEALGKVPRPRPRRRLASWLKRTETLTDVLLVPDRPGEEVVVKVDDALSASGRWRSVPSDERLRRAEMVAVSVYDAVLSAHSPGWSAQSGTCMSDGSPRRAGRCSATDWSGSLRCSRRYLGRGGCRNSGTPRCSA